MANREPESYITFNKEEIHKADDKIFSKIKLWQDRAKPFKRLVNYSLIVATFVLLYFEQYLYMIMSIILWFPDSTQIIKWYKKRILKIEEKDVKEI